MPKIVGREVAIVPKLDTGIIRSSEGDREADECEVLRDRTNHLLKCENADLVTDEMGAGHGRFDGSELDTDIEPFAGKTYPHLTILARFWENGKRKQRVANFQFIPKPNERVQPGDPYYVKIINGNAIVRLSDQIA
jgi:hypothetical protein